ncbi:hypothetical protein QJQ45_018154 [Haematococcus lacustris]|nr:hypothetical protein QJQ45_018154 [Haematococcus lacustris]
MLILAIWKTCSRLLASSWRRIASRSPAGRPCRPCNCSSVLTSSGPMASTGAGAAAAAAADMDRAASAGSIAANEDDDDVAADTDDVASPIAAMVPFTGAAGEGCTAPGEDVNERECVAGARRVFQLSLTASSLALDLQRLELACAFLLTDRLWAVAMADLAQLAVGLHANTAQRMLLTTPSALYSPRPASLSPTSSGPTAMGGQQGPGWVEKLEPFWQLFVTYVVEATAGTEHNLAWWMAAVKASNAYLPDLVTPLQRAQPMNAKMLVVAAAQYVQEGRVQLLSLCCPSQQLRHSTWAGCLMLLPKLQTSHPVLSQASLQQQQGRQQQQL